MRKMKPVHGLGLIAATAAFAGITQPAWGSGFEKTVFWSGKWGGVAGSAVSAVDGPESLYFNPAGMAGKEGAQVSANFSPILAKFSGPFLANQTMDGSTGFSPSFGVLGSYGLSPDLAIGAGVYVGAGSKAVFEDVDLTPFSMKPKVQTNLYEVEASLGAAYQVLPGLKIGAAYRVAFVNAEFSSLTRTDGTGALAGTTILSYANLSDLSKTKWNGFRLGAQYTSEDKRWGAGVMWRTPIDFTAKGKSSGQFEVRNSSTGAVVIPAADITGGDVSVSSSLPSQISAGANYEVLPQMLRLLAQYSWTEYHRNQALGIDGSATLGALGSQSFPNVGLGWMNQTTIGGGVIYTPIPDWAFRAGYAHVSQVTPTTAAKPNLVAPGDAHTIAVGAGRQLMDQKLDLDVAFDYSVASGTGELPAVVGDYSSKAYSLHLGATYRY